MVKRARGVETRASRDAESVRVRFFPHRSQDTDALVLIDKTVRVDRYEGNDDGVWSLYDRTAMLAYWGLSLSALAFYAALSEESDAVLSISTPSTRVCTRRVSHRFGVSQPAKWAAQRAQLSEPRGRTGLGPCALDGLLNEPGRTGLFSVAELFEEGEAVPLRFVREGDEGGEVVLVLGVLAVDRKVRRLGVERSGERDLERGRGGGGETQWAHAAHLPASDREGRALVARAVHAQRSARVRAPAHRRCCSPPACRSFGTRASEGHRGASACKRSGPRTQGPARQPASRAPELARRRLPAQAAARGPLFGPRRSRTTYTCSAGSDPTRVKEEAPEPNCEGLCSRRQKGRPGPGCPRLTHAALRYFLSHGTS